jgi:peptidoglycan hydrolase-like protein with peptidoglycan-binding domain
MNKYISFLIVLSLFVLGGSKAQALSSSNDLIATATCSATAPSITVLSPNGGEVYKAGQQITVKWRSCNIKPTTFVKLGLYVDIGNNYGVVTSTSVLNSGQGIINIPANAKNNNYIVMVGDNSVSGKSNPFTIKSSPSYEEAPLIKLLSPNGGESYHIGSTQKVSWSLNGYPSWDSSHNSIQLQLWNSSGTKYVGTLCVSCFSDQSAGEYNWTINKIIGPNDLLVNVNPGLYKVRASVVSDINLPNFYYTLDFSDKYFKITDAISITEHVEITPNTIISPLPAPVLPQTRTLTVGAKGEDVKAIQTFLGLKADGIFGKVTANKVKEWQILKNLSADGIVGLKTRALMK